MMAISPPEIVMSKAPKLHAVPAVNEWPMTVAEIEGISGLMVLNAQLNDRLNAIRDEAKRRINVGKSADIDFDAQAKVWRRAKPPEGVSNGEASKA